MKSALKKLRPKEVLFVLEYPAQNFNGTKSAIAAGYSKKTAVVTASQLLRKPNVQAALAKSLKKISADHDITMAELVKGMRYNAKRDDEKATHAGNIAGYNSLAKLGGFLTDKVEHSGKIEVDAVSAKDKLALALGIDRGEE